MADQILLSQSLPFFRRRPVRAVLAGLAALAALNAGADAREPRPVRQTEILAPREAGDPMMAIVSIRDQHVTFYDADGWFLRSPVSTGMKGRETPAGVFTILEKKADHRSNLYDDAEMPHMQRLTWNGIAMHGGHLPGRPASKGCIRLPFGLARSLFDETELGMRVIISPEDAAPVEITHPALFMPEAETIASAPKRAETLALEAAEAVRLANQAKKAAKAAARAATPVAATLRKLERQNAKAAAELAAAGKALASAKTDEARIRAEDRQAKAATKVADAQTRLETGKADAETKLADATSAKAAAKAASDNIAEITKAANEAKLALQPVSVYISRDAGKLYVRRNTRKPWPDGGEVYDATIEVPISIRDPDLPIGTHVFTAMASAGEGLRWTAVTINDGDSATRALDRISIPQDVLERIAPGALPRSSIIISDEPLSRETNYRTEFVAVLSDQPQGGFITRRPTVSPPVVSYSPKPWPGGNIFGFGYMNDPPPRYQNYQKRQPTRRTYSKQGWW